jgi:hypothetical protein
MKSLSVVLISAFLVMAISGCGGTNVPPSVANARQSDYTRIAIVCAPGPDADPSYVSPILSYTEQKAAKYLPQLERIDFPDNATVDTTTTPPTVQFADKANYDGIVCLVYSYSGGNIFLDTYMVDAATGKSVWHYTETRRDPDIQKRLLSFGNWTPSILKNQFYGF